MTSGDKNQTYLLFIGFHKVGGMSSLVEMYMNATPSVRHDNSSCGTPRIDSFDVFRDPATADLPWPGVLFHVTFGAVWYFSCDQVFPILCPGSGVVRDCINF